MFSPGEFRDLVSGRRRGLHASVLRAALRTFEYPYTAVVSRRNRRFDSGHSLVHRVDAPVICVGNLTLGGTGKTPAVAWLVEHLREAGVRPAIVSRGYGSGANEQNDEALELELALGSVTHVQDRDRVAAANRAIREHGAEAIVLDDGFQHRRLARDLDVVLLDAMEPFGFDHVFPRGTLREPLDALSRADVVMLSRADVVSDGEREAIRQRVAGYAPDAIWVEATHRPQRFLSCDGTSRALDDLREQPVAAFCGVGNPAGFRHTLQQAGLRVTAFREFPDHHAYREHDLEQLGRWAAESKVQQLVCTRKDLVKIRERRLVDIPLAALTIELDITRGLRELTERLTTLFEKRTRRPIA